MENTPQQIIETFFDLYINQNPTEAIDYIFSTNPWMEQSKHQIENVKSTLNSTLEIIGDYAGHSLITKNNIDSYLTLYTFMVRYDRQPLRFTMLFYRPINEWRLQNFSFDDKLDEELEEASKLYRRKELH